jgi:hypothetical protein
MATAISTIKPPNTKRHQGVPPKPFHTRRPIVGGAELACTVAVRSADRGGVGVGELIAWVVQDYLMRSVPPEICHRIYPATKRSRAGSLTGDAVLYQQL